MSRVCCVLSMPFTRTTESASNGTRAPVARISTSAVRRARSVRRPGGTAKVATLSASDARLNGRNTRLESLPSASVLVSVSVTLASVPSGAGMLPCSSRRGRTTSAAL